MDFIMDVLFTTGEGAVIVGALLFIAILIYIFEKR